MVVATTPRDEERAARERIRNLEKARKAAARARAQSAKAAARERRREVAELRREQARASAAYDKALARACVAPRAEQDAAFDRADREQSRVLGLGARIRRLGSA